MYCGNTPTEVSNERRMTIVWNVTQCSLAYMCRRFGQTYCLHSLL